MRMRCAQQRRSIPPASAAGLASPCQLRTASSQVRKEESNAVEYTRSGWQAASAFQAAWYSPSPGMKATSTWLSGCSTSVVWRSVQASAFARAAASSSSFLLLRWRKEEQDAAAPAWAEAWALRDTMLVQQPDNELDVAFTAEGVRQHSCQSQLTGHGLYNVQLYQPLIIQVLDISTSAYHCNLDRC
jgi:hypothetical protein